eukprot:1940657-Amphidinium_carterae.4
MVDAICNKSSERDVVGDSTLLGGQCYVLIVEVVEVVWRHYCWGYTTGSTPWGHLPGQAPENRSPVDERTNPGVDHGSWLQVMMRVVG